MVIELKLNAENELVIFHKGSYMGRICETWKNKLGIQEGRYRLVAKDPKEKWFKKYAFIGPRYDCGREYFSNPILCMNTATFIGNMFPEKNLFGDLRKKRFVWASKI